MRRLLLTAFVIATAVIAAGCTGSMLGDAKGASSEDNRYVLSPETLNDLGLEEFLQVQLFEKRVLRDAYLLGDHVIMESRDKHIYGIQRMRGDVAFTAELTHPCDFRGDEDEMYLYLPCENTLVAIDKRGFKAYTKYLKRAPAGRPNARSEQYIYLPCYDGKVRAFIKEKSYFAWQYTTGGVVSARPALGTKLVYAGSTDGWLYALDMSNLTEVWRFKTYGPIVADLVHKDRRVYVASTDGNLYCLEDQEQGTRQRQMIWSYSCGAAIRIAPIVSEDVVLVVNADDECHALDKTGGRRLWVVDNIQKVLAHGRLNTYLLRDDRLVVAVDNKTGKVRWILDTAREGYQFFLTNDTDGGIYMVKASGQTQGIREKRFAAPEPAAPAAEGAAAADAAPAADE